MKITLLFLSVFILSILLSCGDASDNASENKSSKLKEYSTSEVVVVRDENAYFKKDMSPFTGILVEDFVYDSVYYFESRDDENWINRSKDSLGKYSMTTWVNGVKNGTEKKWFRKGNIQLARGWKNGFLDGFAQSWFENGNLRGESFWLPIKHSEYIGTPDKFIRQYYENGQLEFDNGYLKGKRHGQQRDWHENGQIRSLSTRVNGKIDGKSEEWYKDGQLASSKEYIMDKPNGIHKEWYWSGQLSSIENYKDGLAIGAFKSFSETGEVIGEVNLNNGNGIFVVSLHENGQKAYEKTFKNGLLNYEKGWYYNGYPKEENIFLNGERAMHKTWHKDGFIEWNVDYINGSTEWSLGNGDKYYESITVNRDSSARYNKISRTYINGVVPDIRYFKFDGSEVEVTMDENSANIVNDYFNNKMSYQEKMTWLSDCKRGLRDISSKMSKSQEEDYCSCLLDKMTLKYPNKNSEVDIQVQIDLAKECLKEMMK